MNPMLARLQEKADALRASMNDILTRAAEEGRDDLNEVENKNLEDAERSIKELDERIAHLSQIELDAANANELAEKVRNATDGKFTTAVHIPQDGDTYQADKLERSYFMDLLTAERDRNKDAQERLKRHQDDLYRATASSNVSEFIPPAYLTNQFVPQVHAGRPVANAIGNAGAPPAQTWYIPRITQTPAVAYQASEGSALTGTDYDAENITCSVLPTLGAVNDITIQTLTYQQGVQFDREVFADLSRKYALEVENVVLNGTATNNKGMLEQAGTNAITYTDGSPSEPEFRSAIAAAALAIDTNRLDSANVIIMAPQRWHWLKSQSANDGRPVITQYNPQNNVGIAGTGVQGIVGEYYGLPVIVSHSVPTLDGGATPSDVDKVIVAKLDDMRLYESGIQTLVDPCPAHSRCDSGCTLTSHSLLLDSPRASASLRALALKAPSTELDA